MKLYIAEGSQDAYATRAKARASILIEEVDVDAGVEPGECLYRAVDDTGDSLLSPLASDVCAWAAGRKGVEISVIYFLR